MKTLTSTLVLLFGLLSAVANGQQQQAAGGGAQAARSKSKAAPRKIGKGKTVPFSPSAKAVFDDVQLFPTQQGMSLALADFDHDGVIDLFVANHAPLIGIMAAPADGVLKAQLRIPAGLVVNAVVEKSPADKAGIRAHDVLLKVTDKPLVTLADLERHLQGRKKVPVEFQLLRKGATRKLTIKPTMWGTPGLTRDTISFVDVQQSRWIGVNATPADATLRKQLRLADGQGLVITEVYEGTPAHKAGLQKSDILLTAAGKTVGRIEDLRKAVNDPKHASVKLTFLRAGKRQAMEIVPHARTSFAPRHSWKTDLYAAGMTIPPTVYSGEIFLAPTVVTKAKTTVVARRVGSTSQRRVERGRFHVQVSNKDKKDKKDKKKSSKPSVAEILKQIDQLRRQVEKLK